MLYKLEEGNAWHFARLQVFRKRDFQNLLADLVVRSQGKPVLVPVSDKRAEMNLASVEFAADNDMKEVNNHE